MASSVAPFSQACDAQLYGDTCTESFFTEGMLRFDGSTSHGSTSPDGICGVGTATGAGCKNDALCAFPHCPMHLTRAALPLQTVGSTTRRLARKSAAGHSCPSTRLARRGLWRTRVRAASRRSGPSAKTPAPARAAGTRVPGAPPCLPRLRCGALAMHACSEP